MTDQLPAKSAHRAGSWVQTERASHEAWAALSVRNPKAGALLHVLAAQVGDHNAVVASQATLARLMGCSKETIKRALTELRAGAWIEVRQIGPTGSVNAYVLNSRVVWSGPRDGIRNALLSATVIVAEDEQPDRDALGRQEPLKRLPRMAGGERQLPAGNGLAPPSEPSLPGMEPDLPSLRDERSGFDEPRPISQFVKEVVSVSEDRDD